MSGELPTRPSMLLRLRDTNDHAAWSQFVAVYTPLIFGFCRSRGLTETDASDVTQDTLRAVVGAMPRFQYDPKRSSFRNWLFTVVRSKLNNFLLARARQPRTAGDTTLADFAGRESDASMEESWQREYQATLVRWAADQIRGEFKVQTWDAFWRTAIEGQPAETVADDLNLSLNALYIARSRVTTRLKQAIQSVDEGETPAGGLGHG